MIVLVAGEGKLLVDSAFAEELNELRGQLEAAIGLDDEIGFRLAVAELRARVRSIGRPAPNRFMAIDLVVPLEGTTIEEARRLLVDEAPTPLPWAWTDDQQPAQASPSPAGLSEVTSPHGETAGASAVPDLVVQTRRSDHQLKAGTTYRVGRDPKSDIHMADSRVSWRHGVLRVDGYAWIFEDLGSTNGTFLGLHRLDRIEISAECVVRLGNPDDGPLLRFMSQAPATAVRQAAAPATAAGQAAAPSAGYPGTARSAQPAPPPPAPKAEPNRDAEPSRETGSWWLPPAAARHVSPSEDAGSRRPPGKPTPPRECSSPAPVSPLGTASSPPVGVGSIAYDTLVRSAFAETVHPGRLLFNPPERMRLGQTERIEVRLTRALTLDAELLERLRGHGEPQLEEIPTAPLMAVTLKGDGFRITAYSDEEQIVTQDGITTWEFDICALKRGQQRLVICVSLRIPAKGQPAEHKSIPVREATIDVQVGAPALAGRFVAANWQWFIGTAIAIAAVLVAVLH